MGTGSWGGERWWREGDNRSTGMGMSKDRCKADGSVLRTSSLSTMCQVFVGVDGRGPRTLGRAPENQSLVSVLATVPSEKGRWGSQHVFGPSCVPGRPYLGKLSPTVLINPQPTHEMVLFFPFYRQWSERLSDFPKVTLLSELQSQDLNPGLILLLFLLCLNFDFL